MKQLIRAEIQALSQMELNEIVEPYVMAHVKDADPHPDIRVYCVSHDGPANLHLPGIGNKTFTWIQAAVQWVSDKLRVGTAVFDRHDPTTNAHDGRTQIGEVIGKTVKRIGDRFSALAAIHVFPEFKARPLDVASIEADIEFAHDGREAWPTRINNVSGVALSSSDIDNPGFPGATLLGAVQAYVQAFGSEIGDRTMNAAEIKAEITKLGLKPSQVFGIDDIMQDTAVADRVKSEKSDVYNMSERMRQERDAARDRVTKLEGEALELNKKIAGHSVQAKSQSVLDTILADTTRKFDDKQKAFIKRGFTKFASEADTDEKLKTDVETFVKASVDEYTALAKEVFGVSNNQNQSPNPFTLPKELADQVNSGKTQNPGDGAGAQNTQTPPNTFDRNYQISAEMNPDVNDFIPGGKAATTAQNA